MAADQPAKRMKLTAGRVTGMSIKEEPVDETMADPDLEIVFVKNEIVIKPPVTWQHRIAITEAEKAEREKKLAEIKQAREVEEQRIAEVTARTREIEEREEAVRAKKTRQALLVLKVQSVFGTENVLGRLGDLFTYSDIKYREAVVHAHKNWRRAIVVTTPEVEASCRKYIRAEGYAEEYFRVISLNIRRAKNMRYLASETGKLADDIYKVIHEDTATQKVLWKLIRRLNSGVVICKTDKEAADLSASSKHPDLWATFTWAGKRRNGEHRLGFANESPPQSTIAIEEAEVEKLAEEKPHLKEELASLKEQTDRTALKLKDVAKEVDRLDYVIVVKKEYCAANAASDIPLE